MSWVAVVKIHRTIHAKTRTGGQHMNTTQQTCAHTTTYHDIMNVVDIFITDLKNTASTAKFDMLEKYFVGDRDTQYYIELPTRYVASRIYIDITDPSWCVDRPLPAHIIDIFKDIYVAIDNYMIIKKLI